MSTIYPNEMFTFQSYTCSYKEVSPQKNLNFFAAHFAWQKIWNKKGVHQAQHSFKINAQNVRQNKTLKKL